MPALPTTSPPTATRTGRPAATTERNISSRIVRAATMPISSPVPRTSPSAVRGQLAAERDPQPVGAGRRHRLLQRLGVTHQVTVRDGDVVADGQQHRGAVLGDSRRVDREDVRHDAESLVEPVEGLVRHRFNSGVVDDDLGAGVAGLGEVGPQQVHPTLGGGARRGVPVLLGGRAHGGGESEGGRDADDPEEDRAPRVGSGVTAQRAEDAVHGRSVASRPWAAIATGSQAGHKWPPKPRLRGWDA